MEHPEGSCLRGALKTKVERGPQEEEVGAGGETQLHPSPHL